MYFTRKRGCPKFFLTHFSISLVLKHRRFSSNTDTNNAWQSKQKTCENWSNKTGFVQEKVIQTKMF